MGSIEIAKANAQTVYNSLSKKFTDFKCFDPLTSMKNDFESVLSLLTKFE